MAKKKAKRIGLFDMLMMIMAAVGLVLAVVGICIPFFTMNTTVLNGENVTNFGLFDDYAAIELAMEEGGLTIGLVQAFAIVSLVLTVLATLIVILGKLGILRFKGILKLIFAILVIVIAALVITFAATYASQYVISGSIGSLAGNSFNAGTGAYFVMAGGVVAGVALLVSKLK